MRANIFKIYEKTVGSQSVEATGVYVTFTTGRKIGKTANQIDLSEGICAYANSKDSQ